MTSTKSVSETFLLVIDTNQYSGNFERELCAYVTGQIGDCEVGEELADEAKESMEHLAWWDSHIKQVEDEDHSEVFRPCAIYENPDYFNDGYGGHYLKSISQEELDIIKDRVINATIQRDAQSVEDVTKRLAEKNFTHGWTEETCKKYLNQVKSNQEALKSGPVRQHVAYMSVAIYMDELPPKDVLSEAKARAYEFFQNCYNYNAGAAVEITGFRLLKKSVETSVLIIEEVLS